MNNKLIKLIDIRTNAKPKATNTKAVNGIVFDPLNEHRFASHFEVYL
jgi:hypothetical protein